MPELKKFPVYGDSGRIGTLAAAARFLDSRAEKTIELEDGGEISVPSEALTVRSDGSFFLRDASTRIRGEAAMPAPPPEVNGKAPEAAPEVKPVMVSETQMFRDGYSIERVKLDRIVAEAPQQRQEGDTLVLPVVEEVLVTEKRLMLREEIRITRHREPVQQVQTIVKP